MGACMVKEVSKTTNQKATTEHCLEIDPVAAKTGGVELKKNYHISSTNKILGAGMFGKVFLSHNIADPSLEVAIKLFNKTKLKADQVNRIKEEVKILTTLDHPNIVKYYQTYEDSKYMYLVMEYCPGGELFDLIAAQENQAFSESEACSIMQKLLRAVNHCHFWGITH